MNQNQMTAFGDTLGAAFFPVAVPREVLRYYWDSLKAYELRDVQVAIDRATKDQADTSPLTIKKILKHLIGDVNELAAATWTIVNRAADKFCPNGYVVFFDKATCSALDEVGGLTALYEASETSLQFLRRDFLKSFMRHWQEGTGKIIRFCCGTKHDGNVRNIDMKREWTKCGVPAKLQRLPSGKKQITSGEKPSGTEALKNVMEKVRELE